VAVAPLFEKGAKFPFFSLQFLRGGDNMNYISWNDLFFVLGFLIAFAQFIINNYNGKK
jgi:hypothetical protein